MSERRSGEGRILSEKAWTLEAYVLHNEGMRTGEEKFQIERDKRYTEGNELRAMALKIKETADANALELAREAQIYKEERNDIMREQNLKSVGNYATRDDLSGAIQEIRNAIKPLVDYVSGQQGASKGSQLTMGKIFAGIAAMGTIIGILVVLGNAFIR